MNRMVFATALVVGWVSDLAAQGTAEGMAYVPPAPPTGPTATELVVRLVYLTAGVLVCCGLVIWFARRKLDGGAAVVAPGGRIVHESALALDHRSAVHLIRVDGYAVAAACDGNGLKSLTLLPPAFAGLVPDPEAGPDDA